jgi:hypothetical protein
MEGAPDTSSLRHSAEEALARGDWETARAHFQEMLEKEETPEALEGLGRACWWLDDVHALFATHRLSPSLPGLRDQLTQRLPQGSVIKAQAIYDEPFWRAEGSSRSPERCTGSRRRTDLGPLARLGRASSDPRVGAGVRLLSR